MSKVCEYCGKHPQTGNTVSHAHNLNKRRFMFNIQRLKALIHGSVKFIYVCTKCIKRGRVVRPTTRSYTRNA